MDNQAYDQAYTQSVAPKPTTVAGIVSLVLGILAIASSWVPILNNASFLLGILGLVFGIVGIVGVCRNKKKGMGFAVAGIVLAVVSVVVVLVTQAAYSNALEDATTKALNGSSVALTTSNEASDAATASATSTNLELGSAVTLESGLVVSVDAVALNLTNYDGSAITGITVTYTNNSSKELSFNMYDWKAQDANGALSSSTYYSAAGNEQLSSGKLAAGGTVTGTIYFDAPIVQANYYNSMLSDSPTATWTLPAE